MAKLHSIFILFFGFENGTRFVFALKKDFSRSFARLKNSFYDCGADLA